MQPVSGKSHQFSGAVDNLIEVGSPLPTQQDLTPDKPKAAILFVHGLTGTPTEMRPVSKYMARRGYHVTTPLLKGHGETYQELLATGWQDWLQTIEDAADQLAKEYESVYLVGLSMGSLLAVSCVADKPFMKGVVILSPTMHLFSKGQSPLQGLLPLLRKIPFLFDKLYWEEKPPYGLKDTRLQQRITKAILQSKENTANQYGLFKLYLGCLYQLYELIKHVKVIAKNVTCPALIVHSTEDTRMPVENATQMLLALGSADKTLKFINNCDHVMTIDLEKMKVCRLVEAFIAEQENAKV